jgi:hypothetical protein
MKELRSVKELPWNEGWAVGTMTAELILKILNEKKPKTILDVGSGLSTVLFAEWAKENNAKVISLEHQERFYNETKELLDNYGLTADLRLVDLIKDEHGYFYDTELPDEIDFALIDGPPGSIGRGATIYAIFPHFSDDFVAWLDDSHRDYEAAILAQWKKDLPIKISKREGFYRGAMITRKKGRNKKC